MSEPDFPTVLQGEVMLLDWSETAKGGSKVVLQLDSPEALIPFRSLTLAKRGVAGQRLACIIKLLPDDDSPPPAAGIGAAGGDPAGARGVVAKTGVPSAVGPKCARTIQWCRDPTFQQWFSGAYPAQVEAAADSVPASRKDFAEAITKLALQMLLGYSGSRKEIDSNPRVAKEWEELVRIPWMAHQGIEEDPF